MMKYTLMAAALALVVSACLPKAEAAVEVGQPAPAFTATDSNGTTHSLSDFKGKIVVLEWNNPECPYVIKHYDSKNMQSLQEKYTAQDVVWLTVNSGAQGKQGHMTAEQANGYLADKGSKATAYLLDANGALGSLYGAKVTPHMYVINADGILVYNGAIDDNNSAKIETVEGATNYVAAAIDALQAGQPVDVATSQPYGCGVKYE
jgi:peroxiredoxin